MEVYAPGSIKLLGEHAVIYGKLWISAAIGLRAKAELKSNSSGKLVVNLPDIGKRAEFDREGLSSIYGRYSKKSTIKGYVEGSDLDIEILPFATIAARLYSQYQADIFNKEITITSEMRRKKGYATSAACVTAFTVCLVKAAGVRMTDGEIVDAARDGERVAHMNANAGGGDVNTSFYGGIITYSNSTGPHKAALNTQMNLVLVDTGPKRSTADTVGHVADLYNNDRKHTEEILNRINDCSVKGLECLKNNDLRGFGQLMYEDHELLRQLGVSSEGLDRAVEIGRENGAYGVKLSGGGGGGMAIAIGKNPDKLVAAFSKAGFEVERTSILMEGARKYLADQV